MLHRRDSYWLKVIIYLKIFTKLPFIKRCSLSALPSRTVLRASQARRLFHTSESEADFTGLKFRCWQVCNLYWRLQRRIRVLAFPASRDFPYFLAHGPLAIFKASYNELNLFHIESFQPSLCPRLPLLRTLVITLGPPI